MAQLPREKLTGKLNQYWSEEVNEDMIDALAKIDIEICIKEQPRLGIVGASKDFEGEILTFPYGYENAIS